MANRFSVGDKVALTKGMRSPSAVVFVPKGTKGVVTWADGDKYVVKFRLDNGTKIDLQIMGREIQKTGLWAGR